MRLRYELTRWDVFASSARAIFWNKALRISCIPALIFLWWFTFSYDFESHSQLNKVIQSTIGTLTVATIAIFGGMSVLAIIALSHKEGKGVLGEHVLEITDEGLVESTEANRSLANWKTAFRIRQSKRYFYIYINPENVYAVPRRVRPLEGSTDEFVAELQRQIAKNKR
jgi:hypothetical protein